MHALAKASAEKSLNKTERMKPPDHVSKCMAKHLMLFMLEFRESRPSACKDCFSPFSHRDPIVTRTIGKVCWMTMRNQSGPKKEVTEGNRDQATIQAVRVIEFSNTVTRLDLKELPRLLGANRKKTVLFFTKHFFTLDFLQGILVNKVKDEISLQKCQKIHFVPSKKRVGFFRLAIKIHYIISSVYVMN